MRMKIDYSIEFTEGVAALLHQLNVSILISTYQAGKLIAIGSSDGMKLMQIPFGFKKPMGIALQDDKMAIATLDEVQFLSAKGAIEKNKNDNPKEFDKFYVHRASYNTSRLDIHDLDFGKGVLWGVNTAFSCLCKFDINYSFVPKWSPDYITDLMPEDRCHLNGMAMENDLPKYVTALSATNTKEGWRKNIMNAGVVMEVPSSEILLEGLAMPHSPRLIKGELYVLESGTGDLIKIDRNGNGCEVVYSFNRFVRGMSYHQGYLFIGASQIRETSKTFQGLDVTKNSKQAGVIIFDLDKGFVVGEINYTKSIQEIFDVQIITNANKPAILNSDDERTKQVIVTPLDVFWQKKKEGTSQESKQK